MGASALSGREQGTLRVAVDGAVRDGFATGRRSDLVPGTDDAAARRTLRAQIARLEHELADAFVTAFPMGGLPQPKAVAARPRLLDLGELERVRDELSERLHEARATITRRADEQAQKRLELELMLLHPAEHRFTRIPCRELGEPGCGVWQVRPRMGLIGMLMGWWQVKLSSGCPLAGGRGRAARQPVARRTADPEFWWRAARAGMVC